MPNYEDPIVVRIIQEAGAAVGASSGSKQSSGGGGSGAASFAKIGGQLGGLVAIVGEVAGILKDGLANIIGPIRNLLVSGVKLIAQLLRPIVDVFIILVKPLLDFLAPIIRVAMQAFQPFRQAAMVLMQKASLALRSGDLGGYQKNTAGALGFIMAGTTSMLMTIVGEMVKLMTMAMGELLKPILPDAWVNKTVAWVNTGVDKVVQGAGDLLYKGATSFVGTFDSELATQLEEMKADSMPKVAGAASQLDQSFINAASDPKYQQQAYNAGAALAKEFIRGAKSKSGSSSSSGKESITNSSGQAIGYTDTTNQKSVYTGVSYTSSADYLKYQAETKTIKWNDSSTWKYLSGGYSE